MTAGSTAEEVIVWALEQRTFSRTPVEQKAAAIMREFGFNGLQVVRTADVAKWRAETECLRRALEAVKNVVKNTDEDGKVPYAYILDAQTALAILDAT